MTEFVMSMINVPIRTTQSIPMKIGIPDGCEGCSDYINDMSGTNITQDTSAQIAVVSNGKVQTGNSIDYHAGNYVELMTGFEVKSGATFHAFIKPCN